jgi:hypothetical protein
LEIIIAGVFLYQYVAGSSVFIIKLTIFRRLLGVSAFAGFFILVIGWPLNSYIANRSIRIHKGLLAARDKRMSVISELIGAVRLESSFSEFQDASHCPPP